MVLSLIFKQQIKYWHLNCLVVGLMKNLIILFRTFWSFSDKKFTNSMKIFRK